MHCPDSSLPKGGATALRSVQVPNYGFREAPSVPRSRPQDTQVAKFLRVGVHHSNVSGYTSKAWTIRRIGSTVLLKWGSVEVRRAGPGRRIYWASRPRQRTVRCGSEKRALEYVKRAIARRRGHRYERLLERVRIGPRPARRPVEPGRVLATVLFVDIVRSTEKAALLGDRRWNEVLGTGGARVGRTNWLGSHVGVMPPAFEFVLVFCRFPILTLGAQASSVICCTGRSGKSSAIRRTGKKTIASFSRPGEYVIGSTGASPPSGR